MSVQFLDNNPKYTWRNIPLSTVHVGSLTTRATAFNRQLHTLFFPNDNKIPDKLSKCHMRFHTQSLPFQWLSSERLV